MDLAVTFFVSIYGLAALSSGVLAWAEQTPSVTALTAPLAICALLLNERYRVVRLSTLWSGLAGLVAMIIFMVEILVGNEESPLLGVAHLITMVQCVFLFHDKQAPQYWWIFAMSCLQIALAAVLTSSAVFGLMILIYMLWALWTLSVFTLLLGRLKYGRAELPEAETEKWAWPELGETPEEFAADPPVANGSVPHSNYRNSIHCDFPEADISWRFVFGVGTLSTAALLLGLIIFLLTPRLWLGTGNALQDTPLDGLGRSMTGFSEKVQLSDFGRILESSAPVLELTLVDEDSGEPVHLGRFLAQLQQEEPLLRGTVLGEYRQGEWLSLETPPANVLQGGPPVGSEGQPYVRETIRLENIGTKTVFSLAEPHYGFVEDEIGSMKVVHANKTLQFVSLSGPFHGAIRYNMMIAERKGKSDFPLYSLPPPPRQPDARIEQDPEEQAEREETEPYLSRPDNLPLVHQTAASIVARTRRQQGSGSPQARVAREFVKYLRDSGQFQYSLDQSVFDPSIDPIEDFLMNRRKGHCQYFATALALLLRSVGIPSRVITGFKGGIEYPEEGRLEVQQRHAHAWVEAYIDRQWVTLDATPASREDSVEDIGSRAGWMNSIYTFFSGLWNDYVVNLSFYKQQRDLYAPFQQLGLTLKEQVQGKSNLISVVKRSLLNFWQHPEQWFSLQGGLTALVLMLSLVGPYYLTRALFRRAKRLILGARHRSRRGIRVDFYEQYLKAVKLLGLVPQPQQTQLEFAQQVEADWLVRKYPAEFLPLMREICAAFYRLRFGDQPLSPDQDSSIRNGLQKMELHLRQASKLV